MQRRWTEVQELLGLYYRSRRTSLDENLHIECQLSPVGKGGRRALDVASDTRWDKGEARDVMSVWLLR
jgi:hypothetical protein